MPSQNITTTYTNTYLNGLPLDANNLKDFISNPLLLPITQIPMIQALSKHQHWRHVPDLIKAGRFVPLLARLCTTPPTKSSLFPLMKQDADAEYPPWLYLDTIPQWFEGSPAWPLRLRGGPPVRRYPPPIRMIHACITTAGSRGVYNEEKEKEPRGGRTQNTRLISSASSLQEAARVISFSLTP